MTNTKSSVIKDFSYNSSTNELTLTFAKNDKTYTYPNVPQDVYQELTQVESKGQSLGSFVNSRITNVFVAK